jgi:hypothetical protein
MMEWPIRAFGYGTFKPIGMWSVLAVRSEDPGRT